MTTKIGGYVPIAEMLQAQANKRKRKKEASKEFVETSQKVVKTAKTVKTPSFTQSPENRTLASIQPQSKIEWSETSLPSSVSVNDQPTCLMRQTSEKENAADFNSFSELELVPDAGSFLLPPSVAPVPSSTSSSPLKTPTKGKPAEVPFESPPLKSPMQYHYSSYFDSESLGKVNKAVKKFKGKTTHTLASPSAKKDAHLIMDHYAALKKDKEVSLPSPDKATITMVEKDRFVVKRKKEGKEREFGVHRQADSDSARLYPSKGSGFISISGSQLFDQFQEFKSNRASGPSPISFLEQVSNSVKERSGSVSPEDLPPPLPSEEE